jgi:meso-butanediol dehydrogenase/(S,S)-butanediol dehydrogenase/diacetyl reductase
VKGRRALVTGGAGGIGSAVARELGARGGSVVLLDRDADQAAAIASEIGAAGYVVADVRNATEVAAATARAAVFLDGVVDILVNAAGIYRIRPAVDLGVDEWEDVLGINLRGTWLASREVARSLLASGVPGAIVNISSTAGLIADRSEPAAHYNASKAGVIALTRQCAVEWAPTIRVNAVCPGVIDTPMLRLMDDPAAGQTYVETMVPLGRLGRPDDVARAIAFLASDDAAYVTGVALPVDGGVTSL